jgi:hypothetical protein
MGGKSLECVGTEVEGFPPGYGTTSRDKRQAMRNVIADWR